MSLIIPHGLIPSIPAGLSLTLESVVSLYATFKNFLDVKPPPESPCGAKDLLVLQEHIRNIGIAANAEKGPENSTPDDSCSSGKIEKKARGAIKKILNQPTHLALTTKNGDDKIIELIKGFSFDYLTKDSGMIEGFKEYTEIRYFSDKYPNRVRHRQQLLRSSIHLEQKV